MRKTRIICTLGPSTDDIDVLKSILQAGMNVARLNFSHGTHDEHRRRIALLRQAELETGITVALMLDTGGPEIRTGQVRDGRVELAPGREFILTTRQILGDSDQVSVSYPLLPASVKPGQNILLDDGLIRLEVRRTDGSEIYCEILDGSALTNRRGVNVPGADLPFPVLTEKDREDLRFGVEQGVDIIAASFVRNKEDVKMIRDLLRDLGGRQMIVAKIESQQGVTNMEEILQSADGLMVARGDLGVEIAAEEVPMVQKEMIRLCNIVGKPVITATQMLDSMMRNARPTRAEASDVANAILDGTDGVMLSGETAAGHYPIEAVKTMARIAQRTDASPNLRHQVDRRFNHPEEVADPISDSVARAACLLSEKIQAKAILTSTQAGFTARQISRFRPHAMILATTPVDMVRRQLLLTWGVLPLLVEQNSSTDELMRTALLAACQAGYLNTDDLVVITAGVPVGKTGSTNLIKVQRVGEPVA
ncbi:MAG: pyruvate kinase [Peptococcaceae bacterium]|jgi:pyruvate kinase|nr:pyruvate kinase [Peptococcaceae bacterium]